MSTLTPAALLAQLQWRYATKAFDPTKKIPADVWSAVEQALILSPSSYGLQPWKFLVITDPALRAQLRPVSWNQSQITDASHLVVFASKLVMTEADAQHLIDRTAAVRGIPAEALEGYKGMMVSDLVKGPRAATINEWAKKQTYIALGNLMTSAAVLGLDTCPIEGFDPVAYDKILGLTAQGLTAAVVCPVGYRAEGDKYATLPKVRYEASELVEHR
jgi:nitroreductase